MFGKTKSKKTSPADDTARRAAHGMLTSALDEPIRIAAPFARLRDHVDAARAAYDAGEGSTAAFAEVLAAAIITDPAGAEWTIGAETGRWYRRIGGGDWAPALPPEETADEAFGEEPDLIAAIAAGAGPLPATLASPPEAAHESSTIPARLLPVEGHEGADRVELVTDDPTRVAPPVTDPADDPIAALLASGYGEDAPGE